MDLTADQRPDTKLDTKLCRINDQWRIIFRWTDLGATDVAITDYH